MQAISTAAAGMQAQAIRVARIADNVANHSTPGFQARPTDSAALDGSATAATSLALNGGPHSLADHSTVALAREFGNLIQAQRSYEANVSVLRTADEMAQAVIKTSEGVDRRA